MDNYAKQWFSHYPASLFPARPIRYRTIAKLLLIIAAIAGTAWMLRSLNLRELWSVLARANPVWLAIGVLANIVSQIGRAAGWNSLLAGVRRIAFSRLVRIEFAVQAAAAVTPEGAGELIRVSYLSHLGVTRTRTLTVMFIRKFSSCMSLVPFLALLWWPGGRISGWWLSAAWLYFGVLVSAAFFLIWAARRPRLPAKIGPTRRVWLEARAAVGSIRDPKVVAQIGSATLLTRSCDIIGLRAITCALNLDIPWHVTVLILLSLELSMVLPNAPAQVGTFEAAVLVATSSTLTQTEGLAIALLFHAQQLLPQLPLGAAAILKEKITRRKEGEIQ